MADQLAKAGIAPADLVAVGTALSAAAAAGLIMKTGLKQLEMMRVENSEQTPADRAEKARAMGEAMKANYEGMARVFDSVDIKGIVKEALVVGSVLPDKV